MIFIKKIQIKKKFILFLFNYFLKLFLLHKS